MMLLVKIVVLTFTSPGVLPISVFLQYADCIDWIFFPNAASFDPFFGPENNFWYTSVYWSQIFYRYLFYSYTCCIGFCSIFKYFFADSFNSHQVGGQHLVLFKQQVNVNAVLRLILHEGSGYLYTIWRLYIVSNGIAILRQNSHLL